MKTKETVLITGASRGIGFELARQFARHGHPLVITARDHGDLVQAAEALERERGVQVGIIAKNLEDPNAPQEIFDALEREGWAVDILVNNAGHGQKGRFWDTPLEKDISILRVNIEAVVRLTRLFLPGMLLRGRGRILNTASIAGFEPGPLLAVYYASKAFVLSFSESLATELEDTEITVTALCPGPTDTDFFLKADMLDTRAFQQAKVMAPQEVAEQGYKALMRGDRVHVTGLVNKTLVFSRRFMTEHAQAKVNEKLMQTVKPEDRKHVPGEFRRKYDEKHPPRN